MRLSSVFGLLNLANKTRHIRGNAKLADTENIITPAKKRQML